MVTSCCIAKNNNKLAIMLFDEWQRLNKTKYDQDQNGRNLIRQNVNDY
jgi:hypothetical protein